MESAVTEPWNMNWHTPPSAEAAPKTPPWEMNWRTDSAPAKDDARVELAKGLREGKRGDADVYRTAAFRTNQGVRPANVTDAAVSGATMGWSDEASALARMPIDMALRGESYDEAYAHNLAAERDRLAQYKKENPRSSIAAELAGAAITPIGSAGAVKSGLLIGGAAGAGTSEDGSVSGVATDAAKGAAFGGALGAAIPAVSNAVRTIAAPVTRNIAAAFNPERRAVEQLATDLARDKVSPAAARAAIDEASAMGKPMTLADVGGRNVMGLTRAVATGKSAGSERVNAMLDARRLDAPDRIVGDIKSALGSPEAFYPTLDRIIARRKDIAAPLYEAAYAKQAPDTPIIRSILSTPAGQKAVANAKTLSANEGIEFAADVRGLDLVKRSLDDMIGAAQRGGATNEVRVLTVMKERLLREIDRRVPEYKAARQAYSSESELKDALEMGRTLFKEDPEIALKAIRAMSPTEREVARLGMARELKAMFDDPRFTLSRVNQLLNSDRMKKVVGAIFESPEAYNSFRQSLTKEAVMLRRGQQVQGNSVTMNKAAEADDVNVIAPAKQFLEGQPVRAAIATASQFGARAAKGINERTSNVLGDMLSTADPAKQRQVLDAIEQMLPPGALQQIMGQLGAREENVIERGLIGKP